MTDQGPRAILRGHCPNCDADLNAEVLAEDTSPPRSMRSGTPGTAGNMCQAADSDEVAH
jgi:hypothetical protein